MLQAHKSQTFRLINPIFVAENVRIKYSKNVPSDPLNLLPSVALREIAPQYIFMVFEVNSDRS